MSEDAIPVREARNRAVADAIAKVRAIVAARGEGSQALEEIKVVMCKLAGQRELFTLDDFPLPDRSTGTENCLYRISEDADHRYALYANVSHTGKHSPPHNHTTWAVIAGVRGSELNRLYERVDDGKAPGIGKVNQVREVNVVPASGICFSPTDIHSIHVVESEPILHLHIYGLALEQLAGRIGFNMEKGTYTVYPPHRDIRAVP